MKFTAKFSPEQRVVFDGNAKRIAASVTIRKQATASVMRRVAAAATIAAERRRRQEATSEEVRLARAANPPISREDLHPHLRGQ